MKKTKDVNKLKDMLKNLIRMVEFEPGERQQITLARGLKIECEKMETGYYLEISRKNTKPSTMEWKTICKNLPFKNRETPIMFRSNGSHCMAGLIKK